MKKICLIMLCSSLVSAVYSQGLYVKFGGGYAIPMGSQTLFEPYNTTVVTGNAEVATTKYEAVKGSYGAGTVFNAAVGFKFSPFIGFDLNLSYQLGKEFTGTTSLSGAGVSAVVEERTKSKGFYAAPTLMFMAGSESVRPYALVGVITGKVNLTSESSAVYTGITDLPIEYDLEQETKGDMAFGFRGGIGVDVNVGNRISIYAEGIFNSISYYAKESEVTTLIVDGEDVRGEADVSFLRTVYVDEITVTTINDVEQTDPNAPGQELRSPSPLSSLGINVGVKIKLGSD